MLAKIVILTASLLATSSPAWAATDTTTFDANVVILSDCTVTVSAATNVNFGSVASTSTANLDQQGSLTTRCTPGTPYSIELDAGLNPGTPGDTTTRRMKNTDGGVTSNNHVAYQLFQDIPRTQHWGAAGNALSSTGTGSTIVYTVYGRIPNPSLNNAAAGSLADTITATMTY